MLGALVGGLVDERQDGSRAFRQEGRDRAASLMINGFV
jgi:hypothetical protein